MGPTHEATQYSHSNFNFPKKIPFSFPNKISFNFPKKNYFNFPKKISFSMKVQGTSGTLSLLRYNPPPFSPSISCTPSFFLPKRRLSMPASIDTYRAETAQMNQLSCEPNGSQLKDHMYKFANFRQPSFPNLVSCTPMTQNGAKEFTQMYLKRNSMEMICG